MILINKTRKNKQTNQQRWKLSRQSHEERSKEKLSGKKRKKERKSYALANQTKEMWNVVQPRPIQKKKREERRSV